MSVQEAIAAFGTELRVQLVHYYWRRPGSQADAGRALGVNPRLVGLNATALVELGVLVESAQSRGRAKTYYVDAVRVAKLKSALDAYLSVPPSWDS